MLIRPGQIGRVGATKRFALPILPLVIKALADGDSITAYSVSNGGWDSYARLWKAAHLSVDHTISAVGGASIGAPGDAPGTNSLYGRLAANLALNPTHVSIFIGANDMIGYASAQAFVDALFALTDNYKNAGAKVIVGTILPRTGVTGWSARRAQVNTLIRAGSGTRINDVFDFDTSYMGVDGAENSTANYADGLHPTAAGQSALLRVFQIPWNHLLGIANEPLDFAFAPATGATADTDVASGTYTVSGFYAGESRPYQAAAGVYVSKNGGAYVLAGSGTVINGDTLRVRIHSSATAAQTVNGSLTLGTTVATFSVTTAGAGTRDWQPTDLGTKLAAWWRSEDIVGADGADMVTWVDASGNGRTLTAGGKGSGRPTVKVNAINGLRAVQFAGALNSWMLPPSNLVTGRTSMATFFMSKSGADPNTSYFGAPIAGWGTGSNDYWFYVNGGIYTEYGSDHRRDNMDPAGLGTDWHQYMLLSAPGDWRIAQDATAFFSDTSNTVAPGSAPLIGYSEGIGSAHDGLLADVVDLNAKPTTTEQQYLEGWFAWKFGPAMVALLPANHPFKTAKPTI